MRIKGMKTDDQRETRNMWWEGKLLPMWCVLRKVAFSTTKMPDCVSFEDWQKCSMPIRVEKTIRRIWWRFVLRMAAGRPLKLTHNYDDKTIAVSVEE